MENSDAFTLMQISKRYRRVEIIINMIHSYAAPDDGEKDFLGGALSDRIWHYLHDFKLTADNQWKYGLESAPDYVSNHDEAFRLLKLFCPEHDYLISDINAGLTRFIQIGPLVEHAYFGATLPLAILRGAFQFHYEALPNGPPIQHPT